MKFILHSFVKCHRDFSFGVIINAAFRINVGNLLIEPAFAHPDFPNPLQQFVEIILAKKLFTLLKAFIVKNKTFDNKFLQGFGCPYTELGGLLRIDSVTDRNNRIKTIKLCIVIFTVSRSCSDFPNN